MNQKERIIKFLRWSQKYTKTDMVYAVRGFSWLMIGKTSLLSLSLLLMWAFANFISKEIYGTYQYVFSIITLSAIFALPGIKTSIIKSIAQKKEGTLWLAVKTRLKYAPIGSLGLLAASVWYFINDNNVLSLAFVVGAVIMPFWGSFGIFEKFWQGKKKFDREIKYAFLSAFLSTLTMIITLYLTDNVIILVFVFFASVSLFDGIFLKITLDKTENNEIDTKAMGFGKNLTAISAIQTIAQHIDKIIIWKFLGPTQVAIYAFAKEPIRKIRDSLFISSLSLPKLGEKKIEGERKKGIIDKFYKLFVITIPIATALAFVAPFIYRLLFLQYLESVIYFQTLCILVALSPFLLLQSALIAEMKKRELYIVQTAAPALKVLLFLVFIPFYQIWGIIIAIITAEIIQGLMTLYFFKKI